MWEVEIRIGAGPGREVVTLPSFAWLKNLHSRSLAHFIHTMQATDTRGAGSARAFLLRIKERWDTANAPTNYALTTDLFLRALGIVYFIAFASLVVQMLGLYGSQGILPIADLMGRQTLTLENVWTMPTVFWLNTSDVFIQIVPIVGALAACLMIAGLHFCVIRILLFVLYLAVVVAGQDFMSFQWDLLLLEVGFIAIFLGDAILVIWLYRWLLFRLMFVSGLVKILSGDPTWHNLTALDYHFETQPLPNIVGFYVHHLPSSIHQFMVAATFFIELAVPFLIFAPRRLRFIAAALITLLHVQIFITGNYNFFNLLAIALCILLLDDALLRRVLDSRIVQFLTRRVPRTRNRLMYWLGSTAAAVLFIVSGFQFLGIFRVPTPGAVATVTQAISPLGIVNEYGPFAVMTTRRPEIIVEGSNDGENWREYEFKYKIGDVHRPPPFVEPHQPRLDWQMWFAALGARTSDPNALLPAVRSNPAMQFRAYESSADVWVINFAVRLLEGSPQVLALMGENPFPDAPPKFIRARLFEYKFADANAPLKDGTWWIRAERGMYLEPMSLGAAQ